MLGLCTRTVKHVGQPVFLSLCKDRLDFVLLAMALEVGFLRLCWQCRSVL